MTLTNILFSLMFLIGIVYLALFRFKQYRMDRFRQNIFALRDDFFDYAAKGNINFQHPAYITFRSLLNGYIRFSHRISLLQVLALSFAEDYLNKEYSPKTFEDTWREVTEGLEDGVKIELDQFREKATANLFYYVFLSSFIKKMVVIPCLLVLFIIQNFKESKGNHSISTGKNKNLGVEVFTYKYSKEQVDESIEYLNTDALAFGKNKTSVSSAYV